MYSGKQIVKGDLVIFSANRSFLLRKRIIDVSVNHLLLQIESNSFILSIIRFWKWVKGILLNTIVTFDTTQHTETLETRIKGKISFHAGDYIVRNLLPSSWIFTKEWWKATTKSSSLREIQRIFFRILWLEKTLLTVPLLWQRSLRQILCKLTKNLLPL